MSFSEGSPSSQDVSPRNSPLRAMAAPSLDMLADFVHEKFPQLKPDHLTVAQVVGTFAYSLIASKAEKENDTELRVVGLIGLGLSAALDALDGPLSRAIKRAGGKHDEERGPIADGWGDAGAETTMSLSRAETAHEQGRPIGEAAAEAAVLTSSLPRILRAVAEANGIVVPEGGKGILGFFGTAFGRRILAIIATAFPHVNLPNGKKIESQAILDSISTIANVYATVSRIDDIVNGQAVLDAREQRKGMKRAIAYAASITAVVGTSYVAHHGRREGINNTPTRAVAIATALASALLAQKALHYSTEEPSTTTDDELNQHYRDTIMQLEVAGNSILEGEHRFVGGILPDLLMYHREGEKLVIDTKVEYDFERRIMRLTGHKPLELMREKDHTARDVDIIHFSTNEARRVAYDQFARNLKKEALKRGYPHSHVGIEGTFFSGGKKRKGALQAVTSSEVDAEGQHFLAFDKLKVPTDPRSTEPWRVMLEDGTSFTVLNPVAHLLRYYMRVPSGLKPKDAQSDKLLALEEFALQFAKEAIKHDRDYYEIHKEWFVYLNQFLYDQSSLTKAKAFIAKLYWATAGEAMSHGRGVFKYIVDKTTGFNG